MSSPFVNPKTRSRGPGDKKMKLECSSDSSSGRLDAILPKKNSMRCKAFLLRVCWRSLKKALSIQQSALSQNRYATQLALAGHSCIPMHALHTHSGRFCRGYFSTPVDVQSQATHCVDV